MLAPPLESWRRSLYVTTCFDRTCCYSQMKNNILLRFTSIDSTFFLNTFCGEIFKKQKMLWTYILLAFLVLRNTQTLVKVRLQQSYMLLIFPINLVQTTFY